MTYTEFEKLLASLTSDTDFNEVLVATLHSVADSEYMKGYEDGVRAGATFKYNYPGDSSCG